MNDRCPDAALAAARRIHVMGLCGTAMGTFAGMLKGRGYEVRGSDAAAYPPMSDQLAEQAIPLMLGYAPQNLDWGPDLVVVGNVIRRTNPEAEAVVARGLPYASFPELFGRLFLAGRRPVVVTGTHGKTTTTSLTAFLLRHAGRDPGLFVGGVPRDFGRSFLLGTGEHVVVEGDEYDTAYFDKVPKFVHYRPAVGLINNIEFDHADIYPDVQAIEREFARFAALVPPEGRLLVNARDARALEAASAARCPVERVGAGDWEARDIALHTGGATFTLWHATRGDLGRFDSPLIGDHNVHNATMALAAVLGEGVSPDAARAGLAAFSGVTKRQEVKGVARGVTVIDDFAHHPTAVRETVRAVAARYPGARLWCCFEVESNTSRRRVFQDAYPPAFDGAHAVLFCKPLDKPDNLPAEARLSLDEVADAIRARGPECHLIPEVPDLVSWLVPRLAPGDVVLGMSGRHFHGLHALVLDALRRLDT